MWFAQRPDSRYVSDLHWFGCADELTHESFLRALAEAGFDDVLRAIGEEWDLDGLAIQSVGFLGVTHATDGHMHIDWTEIDGKAFNVLIPLEQIPGSGPELYIQGTDEDDVGAIKLHPSYGILLGEDTYHCTHECNHRESQKVRMAVTIYIADLTEENVDGVADDDTSMFPPPGATEWLWAQRGRHWGDGKSLAEDIGRGAFRPKDRLDICPTIAKEERCDKNGEWTELHHWRNTCPLSCGMYMSDEEYKPGVPRKDLFP
mmetsp:Transcript_50707/g.152719  ORF Transcript_50707/g.152719 Transcript_50707/m.152719 type:complete len:260 (+) Transcript_50707:628-1407(+)